MNIYLIFYIIFWTLSCCRLLKFNPTENQNIHSTHNQTQTQTQTSFIQQKKIHEYFMNIQLIISPWHIYDYKHVGRLPLRSYLTADMEATRKGEACTAVMKTAMQLINIMAADDLATHGARASTGTWHMYWPCCPVIFRFQYQKD